MQKIGIAIAAVALIAAIILFYQQSTSSAKIEALQSKVDSLQTTAVEEVPLQVNPNSSIYYVHFDSIDLGYTLRQEMIDKLEARYKSYERELETKMKKLEEEVAQAQKDAQYQTDLWRAQKAGELQRKEQELMQRQQQMSDNFNNEMVKLNNELRKEINDFIEEYRKGKNIDYIVSYQALLYANDSLNLTAPILEGLNKRHSMKKANK